MAGTNMKESLRDVTRFMITMQTGLLIFRGAEARRAILAAHAGETFRAIASAGSHVSHAKNKIADTPNYPVFSTRFLG